MCQNQGLSALSPDEKWDSGGPTTPLSVVKIRIKPKNTSYCIHLSVRKENNPEFSAAKQIKDAIVLTSGGGFFPPFFCAFLGRDFRHCHRRGLLGTELRLLREQRSQTQHWCSSTKAPSLTEGTNLALCILNKLLTLLGMKK